MKGFEYMINNLKLSTRTKYVIVGVLIILFSFVLSSFYNEGKLIIPQDNKIIEYSASATANTETTLKDLTLSGNTYISTSSDPFITVNFTEPQSVTEVRLNLSVADDDNTTMFQVFFRDTENGFSEENSVKVNVSSGGYTLEIPQDREYTALRMDITNEQGTSVTISSAQFFCKGNTDLLPGLFPVFLTCVIYFTVSFVLFEFWHLGKTGDKNFCLGELLFAALFTIGVVFVKMHSDGNLYAYVDIGSDTVNSYFPFYTYIADRIRDGNLEIWSTEYGYGNTEFVIIFDPLMSCIVILTAFFGKGFLLYGLVAHKIICVLLSAYFCYKFLCLFSNKYFFAAISSYLYAFNGFSNIWGQHYFFASYSVFTIIVFYSVEKYLREQKKISPLIIIISGMCMATSVYPCYMIYLAAAVYALIRYVYITDNFQIKSFITKFACLLTNVLVGFGMGMFTGLPGIEKILNSGRVGGNGLFQKIKQAVKLNFIEPWWDMPRRMITGPQPKYSFNYYEDQQLFFSVISVIILLQFLFTIHKIYKKPRQMICVYFSVGLALFAVYNGTVPFVLNAFAAVGVYRGLYVLFPAAALMTLTVLDNICNKNIFSYEAVAAGGIISAAALMTPGMWRDENGLYPGVKGMIPICVILLICSVVVLIKLYRSKNKQFAIIMLCAVLGLDCTAELHVTFNRKGLLTEDRYEMWKENEADTSVLLEYAKNNDNDYYRIDKTYSDFNQFTDSLCENYKSLTLYNSQDMTGMMEFYYNYLNDRYNVRRALKAYSGSPYELVQWSMAGLRYVISKYEPYDADHFIPVMENNGITLYKLSDSDSFGTFYTSAVFYDDFRRLGYAEKSKILQGSVVLNDDPVGSPYTVSVGNAIAALGEKDVTRQVISADAYIFPQTLGGEERLEIRFADNWSENIIGEIFMEYSFTSNAVTTVSMFIDTGSGYREVDRCKTNIPAKGTASERFTLPRNTKRVRFDFPQEQVTITNFTVSVTDAPLRPNKTNAVIKDTGKDSHITAEIVCSENGLLFMPIPFDSGWNAYVDGMESEIIRANSGFMAVDLTAGEHTVEFIYKSKAFIYGIIISTVSFVLALTFWYLEKRKINSENPKNDK